MRRKRLKADFFWPLVALAVATMALLVGTVLSLTHQVDVDALEHEQAIVANGFAGMSVEVAGRVTPQAIWDDAVRNLDTQFSQEWASENIGQYLHDVSGFESAFVLDGDDQPLFASRNGQPEGLDAYAPFVSPMRPLIDRVRMAEARRGPWNRTPHEASELAPAIQATGVAMVDGHLRLLTASLVQPDFGHVTPADRAPVIVASMPLDGEFAQSFADRFLLDSLHIHELDSRSERGEAHIILRDTLGRTVATIDWLPRRPGAALLTNVGTPVLLMVTCLILAALLLYRRSTRMAQNLIASEARAKHLAHHDSLTGLANRTRCVDQLEQALARIRRGQGAVGVHCINLNRLKEISDSHGHQTSDELVRMAADRLSAECRSTDTLARMSSDEFAVIQSDATPTAAAALATRLLEVLSWPFTLEAGEFHVAASIGISLVMDSDLEPGEALRQADLAVSRARAEGGGRFCFFEIEMDAAVRHRRELEADLRRALACGELSMVYQPQANHRGQITGVEALVRWRHPTRGAISPAFFIPIAEECGLINDLGAFTLRRAFEDSRAWKDLKVAINVSALQLRRSDFADDLASLVAEMDVDPRRFELEITEGVLMGDDLTTSATLRRLRDMGFSLALDDFGTGYSSLGYLRRFPVDKIKIDRSFVTGLGADSESEAVVRAIVKLARGLNLAVIAEGVETEAQKARLIAAGCPEIQGYLFSKPLEATEINPLRGAQRTKTADTARAA